MAGGSRNRRGSTSTRLKKDKCITWAIAEKGRTPFSQGAVFGGKKTFSCCPHNKCLSSADCWCSTLPQSCQICLLCFHSAAFYRPCCDRIGLQGNLSLPSRNIKRSLNYVRRREKMNVPLKRLSVKWKTTCQFRLPWRGFENKNCLLFLPEMAQSNFY